MVEELAYRGGACLSWRSLLIVEELAYRGGAVIRGVSFYTCGGVLILYIG